MAPSCCGGQLKKIVHITRPKIILYVQTRSKYKRRSSKLGKLSTQIHTQIQTQIQTQIHNNYQHGCQQAKNNNEIQIGLQYTDCVRYIRFLANVNSSSRSLYVVVRPSVGRLSVVCRLSSFCL